MPLNDQSQQSLIRQATAKLLENFTEDLFFKSEGSRVVKCGVPGSVPGVGGTKEVKRSDSHRASPGWERLEKEEQVSLTEETQTFTGFGLWDATSCRWDTLRMSSSDMEPTPAPASVWGHASQSQSAGPPNWSHLVPQPPWPWSLDPPHYPVVLKD